MREPKAIIYDSRRDCLIAFATRAHGDKRRVFVVRDRVSVHLDEDREAMFWGLATTEHEFRKALSAHLWNVSRLTRDDLQRAMAEELTGDGNES